MRIRRAVETDIDGAVDLAERRRLEDQLHQPVFWRKAADSAASTGNFFRTLLAEEETIFLVATVGHRLRGFLIARQFPAPPVYAPGGSTWCIDDFCVVDPAEWQTAGRALLAEASSLLEARGAAQIVVVCGNHDRPKTELLEAAGLSIASNWWTRPLVE
jgi:GNAT superfamily N-acetyltransferase